MNEKITQQANFNRILILILAAGSQVAVKKNQKKEF